MCRYCDDIYLLSYLLFFSFIPLQSKPESRFEVIYSQFFEVSYYDIKVTIPDTYNRFGVTAICHIRRKENAFPDTLRLILGERSMGIKPEFLGVYVKDNDGIRYIWNEPSLKLIIPVHIRKREYIKVRIIYSLRKDSDYGEDPYSKFAFEISDSLCYINAAITRNDNWYPKIQGTLYKRLPDFRLAVDVPSHLEVMASGQLKEFEDRGRRKIHIWENYPEITDRSLYLFAVKAEKEVKTFSDGFKIILFLPEDYRIENVKEISNIIHSSFRFFESRFGEVPGNEYKVMGFPYGYSGLYRSMTIPANLFTHTISNTDIYYPTRSIIHEVSHTWWGNVISANSQQDYWLFEGFAKYSEIIGIKPSGGPNIENLSFSRLKLSTLPYLERVPAIQKSGMEDNRILQRVSSYYMGATFLRMIEYILGENDFFRAMKGYSRKFAGKCINTDDFIDFMDDYLPQEKHGLLNGYLKNSGYSRYTVSENIEGNGMFVSYTIRNTGDKPVIAEYLLLMNGKEKSGEIFIPLQSESIVRAESENLSVDVSFIMDPENIFPVIEENKRGAGGMVYRNQDRQIIFVNVVENTPLSDAGIKDNMILLNMEGEELEGKNLEELNELLLRNEGTVLELNILKNNGDTIDVSVRY